ncbi:unnamed protein product, partial [Nesidiocoris tenuis]
MDSKVKFVVDFGSNRWPSNVFCSARNGGQKCPIQTAEPPQEMPTVHQAEFQNMIEITFDSIHAKPQCSNLNRQTSRSNFNANPRFELETQIEWKLCVPRKFTSLSTGLDGQASISTKPTLSTTTTTATFTSHVDTFDTNSINSSRDQIRLKIQQKNVQNKMPTLHLNIQFLLRGTSEALHPRKPFACQIEQNNYSRFTPSRNSRLNMGHFHFESQSADHRPSLSGVRFKPGSDLPKTSSPSTAVV